VPFFFPLPVDYTGSFLENFGWPALTSLYSPSLMPAPTESTFPFFSKKVSLLRGFRSKRPTVFSPPSLPWLSNPISHIPFRGEVGSQFFVVFYTLKDLVVFFCLVVLLNLHAKNTSLNVRTTDSGPLPVLIPSPIFRMVLDFSYREPIVHNRALGFSPYSLHPSRA